MPNEEDVLATFNVLIVAKFKDIREEDQKEILLRLEEHNLEKIPTVESCWELKCDAEDETDAKDQAMQAFTNVCRTYPFELALVVQAGTGMIQRRRKKFEA